MENFIYFIPALGIIGILVMVGKSIWVSKQDPGDEKMVMISKHISDGAMTFLKAEWKILSYYVVIAGILLAYSGTTIEASSPIIAISFVIGANATISIRDGITGDTLRGNLNADSNAEVVSNGYYRFDIDVEADDIINLRSTQDITAINHFRSHLVQFGA